MKVDAATNFMIFDMLKNILSLSEKPYELGKYITTQLRELVGAKLVLLLSHTEELDLEDHLLIGICPERKRNSLNLNSMKQIAELSHTYHVPTIVSHSNEKGELEKLLLNFGGHTSIIVPLEYASKRNGLILMIDIFDTNNISAVIDSMESLAGVLALELRNGQFYQLLKKEVDERTKELQESEKNYRLLFEQASDGIFIGDKEGHFIEVNTWGCGLFGYTRDEILGKSIPDLITRKDVEKMPIQYAELKRGENIITERLMLRKDGSEFWAEINGKVLGDGRMQGIVRDITERKQTENTLLFLLNSVNIETKENFFESIARYLAESMAMDYVCIDILHGDLLTAQTLAVYFDGKFEDNVEYTLKETPCGDVVGKTICCFPHEVRNIFPKDIVLQEMVAESYLGSTLWSSTGQPIGLIAVIGRKPIKNPKLAETILKLVSVRVAGELERRQTEEELHKSEEKFRNYIESAPDGIFIINSQGYYTNVNKAACDLLGYSHDELLKMHVSQLRLKEEKGKAYQAVEMLNYNSVTNSELVLVRKDGSTLNALLSAVKISENQYLGFLKDIDEIKNTQLELLKAKEKAEESDRLKTAFLQNMSHEIRTPMNAIMGFSGLLADQYNNKPKIEKFSGIITQRCNDLLDIINDILDIAKIESGQLQVNSEECDISGLFAELSSFFKEHQKRIGKQNIKFSLQVQGDFSDTIIITDKIKLKQILINLIGNAFKFTNEGKIEGGCKLDYNQNLIFYVSDTGIGIPIDKQSLVFERFAQLNQEQNKAISGTGLGLSIVKGLVGLLGGEIVLKSEPGVGSTFIFTFPFKKMQTAGNENFVYEELSDYHFPNKLVLVVEDDIYNAEYLKEILSEIGLNIVFADTGKDAVEISLLQPVDLVLMDIRLPDMDGYDATRQIRQHKPNLKIIAQTAYASSLEKQKAIDAGCNDYISKPTKRELLLALISKYLSKVTNH